MIPPNFNITVSGGIVVTANAFITISANTSITVEGGVNIDSVAGLTLQTGTSSFFVAKQQFDVPVLHYLLLLPS
jgi:hypothetical protein